MLAAVRIDLVGTTAVFCRFGPRPSLPINHLLYANRRTAGRIGEDGLGTMFDIPHGHTSCIMLPAVMRWNKPANTERQALVAAAMGHPGEDAGDVLHAFIAGLGMPRSLGAVNIGAENF